MIMVYCAIKHNTHFKGERIMYYFIEFSGGGWVRLDYYTNSGDLSEFKGYIINVELRW